MLQHKYADPQKPSRVVLLGGSGFVGQALAEALRADGVSVLALGSGDLDLTAEGAGAALKARLEPGDSLVVLSALTPDKGRGIAPFMRNMKIAESLCEALLDSGCAQVVYFSSDAVYPLGNAPINEESAAAPTDLYGLMHRGREIMLQENVKQPLCILRPTLIYGAGDSHNSYGPNRFRRQAAKEGKIVIGGEGEETRDHLHIDDLVRLVKLVLAHGSQGLLNLATGRSHDFGSVARMVAALFDPAAEVQTTPRGMPVTHRHFDITALMKAFPGFAFTSLEEGLKKAQGDVA